MTTRQERRRRRDWRNSWGRRLVMAAGWLALAGAVSGIAVFVGTGRPEAVFAGATAALAAVVASWVMPEPAAKRQRKLFRPLESVRRLRRRRTRGLARQLLTLP